MTFVAALFLPSKYLASYKSFFVIKFPSMATHTYENFSDPSFQPPIANRNLVQGYSSFKATTLLYPPGKNL